MGKKVNPRVIRLNTTTSHLSKWFAPKRQFADWLRQDLGLRKFLKTKLRDAGVSRIEIRRSGEQLSVIISTSKPGVIIGRSGSGIEDLRRQIKRRFFGSRQMHLEIEIEEVRQPDLDAELVVQNIIYQLEKRVPFRRVMKRTIEQVMEGGAKGVKVICAGRLNGAEIARTEALSAGSVPTHTLRADIDYSRGAAHTIYGAIGVKVWIYRGQVFADKSRELAVPEAIPVAAAKPTKPERNKRPSGRGKHTVIKKIQK